MELAILPAEEAKRLGAALANRIPWDKAIQAVVDALGAERWVAVARSEYELVADHPTRLKAFEILRDTVVGRPVAQLPSEPEKQLNSSVEHQQHSPQYLEAARRHLAWLEEQARKAPQIESHE